ncbi:hypoxanthine phosphoribosyltransferase [Algoriphagus faecimaris]|uniref:Hypoxanthine phosphoribosyltransferase n=1 Tax=Algoriphagus faecimaris TaxID=686796 RepID=A0A1G6X6T7_9BACT|nr:hypoxanthine phosphoribosyltransferase [Algoriphagus faecimaris]SDD73085.1 hypoxanthine phosphoribosyltransferase [Algoriphagus faecimaris]
MIKTIKGREFEVFIPEQKIIERVKELGLKITTDFNGSELVMIGILNGAFIFASDLCRQIDLPLSLSFVKIASYDGMNSTESVKKLIGLSEDLSGKHVILVEDIVDSGLSMNFLLDHFSSLNPASISIATLLFKPEAFRFNYPLHYVGFEIPNKFVLGYGLDYDGIGRNLSDIYQLV